jgi:hypothetical protein
MINKMDSEKRKVRKEVYTRIYEQFCRKIQSVASGGHKQLMLTVPPFLLGYPTYDLTQAALYLKRQLTISGFDVVFAKPASLFVSWFPVSQKQAVVPAYETPMSAPEEDSTLPSLVNLRKAANKYRASSSSRQPRSS